MRLFANTTSPFVRLVRLAIAEKGLSDQIEVEIVDPWADPAHFLAANPAGRVPTLVTDDGHAIAEAHLILRYLEGLAGPSIYRRRLGGNALKRGGNAWRDRSVHCDYHWAQVQR